MVNVSSYISTLRIAHRALPQDCLFLIMIRKGKQCWLYFTEMIYSLSIDWFDSDEMFTQTYSTSWFAVLTSEGSWSKPVSIALTKLSKDPVDLLIVSQINSICLPKNMSSWSVDVSDQLYLPPKGSVYLIYWKYIRSTLSATSEGFLLCWLQNCMPFSLLR